MALFDRKPAARLAEVPDRMFVWLMLFQWMACIGLALAFAPLLTWGATSAIHPSSRLGGDLVLGGTITCVPPVLLAPAARDP